MEDQTKTIQFFNYIRLARLVSRCGDTILRQLFRTRYKLLTCMEWENRVTSLSQDFFHKYGSSLKLSPEQRAALDSGDIYKWDFTLLAQILVRMDVTSVVSEQSKDKITEEIKEIKELRDVRNWVEHLPSQSIPEVDYLHWWDRTRDVLVKLGANELEIEYIRTTSRLDGLKFQCTTIDEDNLKKAQGLRKQGNQLVMEGQQEEGIELYNKALLLFGLSEIEMSYLYSRRSEAYLGLLEADMELPEDLRESNLAAAMEDARSCTQLRASWWKGHFLTGKVYQLRKLWVEAIDAFENALSTNLHAQDVINARDECRYDQDNDEIENHLDPLLQPSSHCEIIKYFEKMRRRNYVHTMQSSELNMKMVEELSKSEDVRKMSMGSVFMAHRYQHGDMKPLDLKKAAELFKKAANVGSPEGTYNLGRLYLTGQGVKRSIPEGVRLVEKAANYQIKDHDPLYNLGLGIDAGMFIMGRCYALGVGKPRNYNIAADWYRRAALEGCGNASNNLSYLYENGIGMERDSKRALQYQRLAVEQNCPIVMHTLAYRYLQLGDLSKAQYWFDRSIQCGYTFSMVKETEFRKQFQEKYEQLQKLKSQLPPHVRDSGTPLHVLSDRFGRNVCPELDKLLEIFLKSMNPQPATSGGFFLKFLNCYDDLKAWANMGHEYAQILQVVINSFNAGFKLLCQLVGHENVQENVPQVENEALAHMAFCYGAEVDYMVSLPLQLKEKLEGIAREVLNNQKESVHDVNARIVLLHQYATWSEEGNKFARRCKSLYPDVSHFHVTHASFLGFLRRYEEGVKVSMEGLERFPGHYELLYAKAVHLRQSLGGGEDAQNDINSDFSIQSIEKAAQKLNIEPVIAAYQEFIDKAPVGHRKIPESYYSMASMSLLSRNMEQFENYYERGIKAEQSLLPCFLPYDSSYKEKATVMYNLHKASKNNQDSFKKGFTDRLDKLLDEDPQQIEAQRKQQLMNPKRIIVTRACRKRFASRVKAQLKIKGTQMFFIPNTTEGKHTQKAPSRKQIPLLTEIRFEDMDPTIDRVYEGRFINLTIMEEYFNGPMKSIHSVVKDDNHDFQFIYFYNLDRNDKGLEDKLGFGSRVRIMNPYLRLTEDRNLGVRVDDPKSIEYISGGTENPICRYCWKSGPKFSCSRCNKAKYCNKQCQKVDWKELQHDQVCFVIRNLCLARLWSETGEQYT